MKAFGKTLIMISLVLLVGCLLPLYSSIANAAANFPKKPVTLI
jgi:preprotein translocase subunit SecF